LTHTKKEACDKHLLPALGETLAKAGNGRNEACYKDCPTPPRIFIQRTRQQQAAEQAAQKRCAVDQTFNITVSK
jgi:hypothetical protein